MNIQNYKDAIRLTEWATAGVPGITRYVYCVPHTGMLYEVDPADGTITGQKYILDIAFGKMPEEKTLEDYIADSDARSYTWL
jgi:hypothetical protein